jgi:hypothetical protein
MSETIFKMELPLAMPHAIRTLLDDEKGRQFLCSQLFEASFHVNQDEESKFIMALKQDPTRVYGFLFRPDNLLFTMKVNSDAIGNPHKFFLQTLMGELRLIVNIAKEYLTDAAVSRNSGDGKQQKYIG